MTKSNQTTPESFLPLSPPVFHILMALVDEERHGYGIMQEVSALTHDTLRMGPGTLYGSIKRMIGNGLVEESEERPDPEMDDDRRRYYRLTSFGRQVATAEAHRLANLVHQAELRKLLEGTG